MLVKVPDFLREGRGRQDDVGMERGLGDEQVLHHEMVELGQRLARVLQVGIGHRRVFALDIHARDLAGMDRVHDLDHGQPAHGIELLAPELLERAAQVGRGRPAGSPAGTSGSGRRRRRPARCSGRAADAGRCRDGRPGR